MSPGSFPLWTPNDLLYLPTYGPFAGLGPILSSSKPNLTLTGSSEIIADSTNSAANPYMYNKLVMQGSAFVTDNTTTSSIWILANIISFEIGTSQMTASGGNGQDASGSGGGMGGTGGSGGGGGGGIGGPPIVCCCIPPCCLLPGTATGGAGGSGTNGCPGSAQWCGGGACGGSGFGHLVDGFSYGNGGRGLAGGGGGGAGGNGFGGGGGGGTASNAFAIGAGGGAAGGGGIFFGANVITGHLGASVGACHVVSRGGQGGFGNCCCNARPGGSGGGGVIRSFARHYDGCLSVDVSPGPGCGCNIGTATMQKLNPNNTFTTKTFTGHF